MNYCPNCQSEVKENAKFCTNCGYNLKEYQTERSYEVKKNGTYVNEKQPIQTSTSQENISKAAKEYWGYFKRTLLHPSNSFKEDGNNFNGIIQFSLMAILLTLTSFFFSLMWNGGGFSMFFGSLVYNLFFIFATVSIIFLLRKTLHNSQTSFKETTSQFGGLFSGIIILSAIYLLMTMIAPIGLIVPILLISLLIVMFSIAAFNIYLFSSTQKGKIDSYYITLIGNLIMMIFTIVIIRIAFSYVLNDVMRTIEESFYYGF